MTPEIRRKLARHIMRLLKVRSVSFPIAFTDKGQFLIKYIGDSDYEMVLDAVPLPTKSNLDDDNNIELKAVLEKYWFSKEQKEMRNDSFTVSHVAPVVNVYDGGFHKPIIVSTTTEALVPQKRGRPAGAKNKIK